LGSGGIAAIAVPPFSCKEGDKDMNGTKVWWQSKTVWGSIVSLLAGVATLAGVKLDATLQDQLAELVVGIVNIVGGAIAWYGRVKAQGALSWTPEGKSS
jgi:hypothetical protein